MIKTDYGKIVRQMRKDSGMTLAILGERCGIPWRTIQDFELGRHTPSINRVERMLASLGCSIVLQKQPLVTSLDQKLEELYPSLSVRVVNALRNSDVVTVGDLTSKTESDLLRTPNFGRKSLEEVQKLLKSGGLSLKKHGHRRSVAHDNLARLKQKIAEYEQELDDLRKYKDRFARRTHSANRSNLEHQWNVAKPERLWK